MYLYVQLIKEKRLILGDQKGMKKRLPLFRA